MQNIFSVLILAMFVAVSAYAQPEGVTIEHVIGPEFPGAYKHPASITQLANGGLYIAYYGGGGEYEDDSKVWGMRRPKGASAWSTPEPIADTPFLSEGNPVVWQAPDGLVWLFYVQRYGETWSQSRIKAKISEDGARTWSDSMLLTFEEGMMVQGRPIVLHDGDYLLPVYHETGSDRESVGDDTTSLFFRHDPETRTWTPTDKIYSRLGNLQAAVAQITDDYLIAYARRGGNYEPIDDGYIVRAESHDGGRSWTNGVDSQFPNPNAAIDFIRLHSGNLLLVYNESMSERTPLVAALSTDQDETYPHRITIGEGGNTFAYPYVIQQDDGTIRLIYTTNGRTTIEMATFTEEALLNAR